MKNRTLKSRIYKITLFLIFTITPWPFTLLLTNSFASVVLSQVSGKHVLNHKTVTVSSKNKKGLVVLFISAVCPCSASHLNELKSLPKEYPDFNFVGIHSNQNENELVTQNYFSKAELPYPILQDPKATIADQYRAKKTPHAFIISPKGQILYQGGISDCETFQKAKRKYLRAALEDLHQGRPVAQPETRTLGCIIDRGESHVF
ncbi:MAG: redoxin domain-containing protein [Bdellovibrionales bacterium]|nr:redoxin domain-containing protein [Bdellovibrionales bacterium]